MSVSNWLDRFANTVVIAALLAGLPLAAVGFLSAAF